ncbi:MAG TPA: thymidine kinase [Flavobacteriales bacterium]|nr:thymidine kinase [Flavobacteriales bacterium]HIA12178.1 thymidine kinase [Flavobacteriales bacterium]
MFIESAPSGVERSGSIEVICGSMFSGKTEELIRRLKRASYARQKVEIFKPTVDDRYDDSNVVSHDKNTIHSTPVSKPKDIFALANNIDVVGIDEAQFFDDSLVEVCNYLANKGIRVIVAGLDMDYLGKPFGPIPGLMATAESVTKVHAICVKCGNIANHSHRISVEDTLVVVGESQEYEPLCRSCFSALFPPLDVSDGIGNKIKRELPGRPG